jgi:hypothetical protein
MSLQGSFSHATRFDRLEIAPQFSAVLPDLVASFATIEWREQRICQLAPRNPQQFLQAIYGTEQIVWRCHPRSLSKLTKATFCEGLSLIRTLSETPRWCLAQPSRSGQAANGNSVGFSRVRNNPEYPAT